MLIKKILSSFVVCIIAFSLSPVFANGVPEEDQETLCNLVEKLIDKTQNQYGVFQYFEESRSGKILLKDAFLYAIKQNKTDLVKKLIKVLQEFGIDLNDNVGYWTGDLGYWAIRNNNEELYNVLIENGYIIPKKSYYCQKYEDGQGACCEEYKQYPTVLHAAVEAQNLKLVKKFLEDGFDPNSLSKVNWEYTPLHLALNIIGDIASDHKWYGTDYQEFKEKIENSIKIIKILMEYSADTTILGGKFMDETPLSIAQGWLNPDNSDNCYYIHEKTPKEKVQFFKDNYKKIIEILTGN